MAEPVPERIEDRRELREFLLGGLAQADAEALEERIFEDDAAYGQLEEERAELIEEYVAESLSAEDAARFERQRRQSPELAREVAELRDLKVLLERKRDRRKGGFVGAAFAWRSAAMTMAVCLCLLVLAVGVQWRANHRLAGELARERKEQAAVGKAIAVREVRRDAIFFLAAGVVRGPQDVARVEIAPGSTLLQFQIEVPASEGSDAAWSVEVSRNGQEILRCDSVPVRRAGSITYLPVYVAAESLQDGVYSVSIRSAGPAHSESSRTFRVTRGSD
jgi:hypothetical protein